MRPEIQIKRRKPIESNTINNNVIILGILNIIARIEHAVSIAALNSEINTTDSTILQERIRNLEMLLQEKERLIQVLLRGGQHNVK